MSVHNPIMLPAAPCPMARSFRLKSGTTARTSSMERLSPVNFTLSILPRLAVLHSILLLSRSTAILSAMASVHCQGARPKMRHGQCFSRRTTIVSPLLPRLSSPARSSLGGTRPGLWVAVQKTGKAIGNLRQESRWCKVRMTLMNGHGWAS